MRLFIFLLFFPLHIFAADNWHRGHTLNVSLTSAIAKVRPNMFWLSSFNLESSQPIRFNDAAGQFILEKPIIVRSAYDADAAYDITEMYSQKNKRVRFVANLAFNSSGGIISIGYDSGVRSQKLNISQNLYLGINKTIQVKSNSFLGVGLGGWLKGGISESPCIDSYNREYWCQNLTAWTDYHASYPAKYSYLDLRYLYIF